jgi:hypothetical protein
MKYIITESQMDRAVLKYLNTEFGDLEPYKNKKHPNRILFVKDGEVIFEYFIEVGSVFISYRKVWAFLQRFFLLDDMEVGNTLRQWMSEYYNLDVRSNPIPVIDTEKWWDNNVIN